MNTSSKISTLAGAALLVVAAGSAHAQEAGHWSVKLGINQISPQVSSGNLSAPSQPGTQIDVKKATSLIATLAYQIDEHWSAEFYAGLPYKHEIVGAATIAGVGKLGTVKQVSPTLFGQYRFLSAAHTLRPYVGVGPTYAYFYGEEGSGTLTALTNPGGTPTRQSVDAAWGLSAQLGATWALGGRWYLDASVIKTWLKTTTHLSTGQSIDTKLDPVSTNLSIGYRF